MLDGKSAEVPRRTLFEVEREKRWRIWLLFALLVALAFVTAWSSCLIVLGIAYLVIPLLGPPAWLFSPAGVAGVLGAALVLSLIYWGLAQIGARGRLLGAMHCRPLDSGDRYHARLANIVEEMRIATGAPRIECVTVRTVGFNAFAFSDLHGGGVIGVTEGALARLSRQQLQAVVAHEFAHVLSGGYVTVTVSCLLFGVYSSLADTLEGTADAGSDDDAGAAALGALPLRGWLWLMQLASSVVSAAISRERERQADLAAARYTRDPLALAEALRIVGRHPGGAGYIPEGLGPLCIRATGSPGWPAVSWRDTHPPLEERIRALLTVANVSPQDFERQAARAGEDHARREHWTPAPRPAGAPVGAPSSAPAAAAIPTADPDSTRGCSCRGARVPADRDGLPELWRGAGRRALRRHRRLALRALRRPPREHAPGRQAAGAPRGGVHGRAGEAGRPALVRRRPPAARRRACSRASRGHAHRVSALRDPDDAAPLQLRVRGGGGPVRALRPPLVREG